MSDPDIIRSNARVNAWSTLAMNRSAGMTAADAYRLFVDQMVDLTAGLWTLLATALIPTAHILLACWNRTIRHDNFQRRARDIRFGRDRDRLHRV